jgi:hypothetical protein
VEEQSQAESENASRTPKPSTRISELATFAPKARRFNADSNLKAKSAVEALGGDDG